jgi:hypothetical protein
MEAARLKQIDLDYRNHLQAWLNFVVQAKKKAGKHKQKPVYTKFKQFFDYKAALEKQEKKEQSEKSKFSGIGKLLKKGV